VDFAGVIKNKRTVKSLRDAVDGELARGKIAASTIFAKIQKNLIHLREHADAFKFLFADTAQIVLKDHDDLVTLVKSRIADHKAAEEKKEADTRERIRKEEQEKAEKEAAEQHRMRMSEISGIQQQVVIATLGRAGVRKGGTIECIRETLAETEAWTIEESNFGPLTTMAQGAKDKALSEIRTLLADAEASAASAKALSEAAEAAKPAPTPEPQRFIMGGMPDGDYRPSPIASPAPASQAANVVPMQRPAPAVESTATIRLGQINDLIAPIHISAEGLSELGFDPVSTEKGAKNYRETDLPFIYTALIDHIDAVRLQRQAA
jgi:hypothetical protein